MKSEGKTLVADLEDDECPTPSRSLNLDGLSENNNNNSISSSCDDGLCLHKRESVCLRDESLDFDVGKYKGRIQEYLLGGTGREVPFARMVRDRTPAEIARLFLATLHLAGEGSIDITNGEQMDELKISPHQE